MINVDARDLSILDRAEPIVWDDGQRYEFGAHLNQDSSIPVRCGS